MFARLTIWLILNKDRKYISYIEIMLPYKCMIFVTLLFKQKFVTVITVLFIMFLASRVLRCQKLDVGFDPTVQSDVGCNSLTTL